MSDLWTVEVLKRGERWVDLRVRQCHPDSGPMPETKQFALNLLLETAYGMDAQLQRRAVCPLGDVYGIERYWDADKAAERADDYIESVHLYRQVNAPFIEKAAHAAVDKKVLEKGIERDSDDWDSEWDDVWGDYWKSPDGPPIADYRIVVKDPRHIDHLKPGQHFESAAYSVDGGFVSENRDEPPALPGAG